MKILYSHNSLDEYDMFVITKKNNSRFTAVFLVYAAVGRWLYRAVSSFSSSLFNPHSLMYFSTTWLHVILSLPRHLLPSTSSDMIFFTQSSSSFPSTCHNDLTLFCFTASDTDSTPILSLSSALGTVSLSDTPHIYLTILISVRSNLPLCSTVMAHVSLPYIIALLTHVTYSFSISLSDPSLSRSLITP